MTCLREHTTPPPVLTSFYEEKTMQKPDVLDKKVDMLEKDLINADYVPAAARAIALAARGVIEGWSGEETQRLIGNVGLFFLSRTLETDSSLGDYLTGEKEGWVWLEEESHAHYYQNGSRLCAHHDLFKSPVRPYQPECPTCERFLE